MSGELEKLIIRLEADTTILRKALNQADREIAGFGAAVDRNVARSDRRLREFSNSGATHLRRLGAAATLTKLAFKTFNLLDAAGDIDRAARSAGLASETFQELSFAARGVGIAHDTFAKSAERFAVSMADVRANTGQLNTLLRKHLPSVREQLRATKTQEEAYQVMADAVMRLGSEEERTRLAQAAFGANGAELVPVLAKGAAGFAEAAEQARAYGAVLDNELTGQAAQLKKEYDEFMKSLHAGWTRAALGVVQYIRELKNLPRVMTNTFFGKKLEPLAKAVSPGAASPSSAAPGAAGAALPQKPGGSLSFKPDMSREEAEALRLQKEELREIERAWRAVREVQMATLDDLVGDATETAAAKMAALSDAVKKGEISYRDFGAMVRDVQKQTEQANDALLSSSSQFLDQMFEGNKSAATASALINTYQGVSKAIASYPPPQSYAMAAMQAALGFAQVRSIQSTSKNSKGGGTAGGGAAAPAMQAAAPVAEAPAQDRAYTVRMSSMGELLGRRGLRELLENIADAQKDGYRLVVG